MSCLLPLLLLLLLQADATHGATLLHTAVLSGSWPMLQLLLSCVSAHGLSVAAGLSSASGRGLTPLHLLAAAPSAASLLESLLGCRGEAAVLWFESTAQRTSPAQLALAAGRSSLNAMAATALLQLLPGAGAVPAAMPLQAGPVPEVPPLLEQAQLSSTGQYPAPQPCAPSTDKAAGSSAAHAAAEAATQGLVARAAAWKGMAPVPLVLALLMAARASVLAAGQATSWALLADWGAATSVSWLAVAAAGELAGSNANSIIQSSWWQRIAQPCRLVLAPRASSWKLAPCNAPLLVECLAAVGMASALLACIAIINAAVASAGLAVGAAGRPAAPTVSVVHAALDFAWRLGWSAALAAGAMRFGRQEYAAAQRLVLACVLLLVPPAAVTRRLLVTANTFSSWQQLVALALLAGLHVAHTAGGAPRWLLALLASDYMALAVLGAMRHSSLLPPAVLRELLGCMQVLLVRLRLGAWVALKPKAH